ncbi:hypothetical protein ONZ45_g4307 [Pleurotus djamor]|nr:hypothetical protein ONZ45_g4307 [Pleurotus djamor]
MMQSIKPIFEGGAAGWYATKATLRELDEIGSPYVLATLSLKFIIVGGSLAGLAAGFALRKAGHDVLILEQGDESSAASIGGVHSPPNMTRVLNHWGLHPLLERVGTKCCGSNWGGIGSGSSTSEDDGRFNVRILVFEDVAVTAGVKIRYATRVVRVDNRAVTVSLDTGETLCGDIIVGADGPQSLVRKSFMDPTFEQGVEDTHLSFVACVPTKLMEEEEDLKTFLEKKSECTVWLGNEFVLHTSLVDQKQYFCINGFVPHKVTKLPPSRGIWDAQCPIEDFDLNLNDMEPRVRKLLKLAKVATPTTHTLRKSFDTYVSDCGRVVLIGEAAHPMVPDVAHNASMAIEDAATFGHLFSRLQHEDQIPRLMAAYEELRQPRCASTAEHEVLKRAFFKLPPGEAQRARDAGMREALAKESNGWDDIDEEYLNFKYERELDLFAYDPYEVVDDWWTKWGALLDRSSGGGVDKEHPRGLDSLDIAVGNRDAHATNGSRIGLSPVEISVSKS